MDFLQDNHRIARFYRATLPFPPDTCRRSLLEVTTFQPKVIYPSLDERYVAFDANVTYCTMVLVQHERFVVFVNDLMVGCWIRIESE